MRMELIKSFDIADIPETEYNLYTFVTAVVTHIYKEIYMKEKAVSLADRAYETIKTNILNLTYPPGMPLTELLELPVFRFIFDSGRHEEYSCRLEEKVVLYMREGDYKRAFDILKMDHFDTGRITALLSTASDAGQ